MHTLTRLYQGLWSAVLVYVVKDQETGWGGGPRATSSWWLCWRSSSCFLHPIHLPLTQVLGAVGRCGTRNQCNSRAVPLSAPGKPMLLRALEQTSPSRYCRLMLCLQQAARSQPGGFGHRGHLPASAFVLIPWDTALASRPTGGTVFEVPPAFGAIFASRACGGSGTGSVVRSEELEGDTTAKTKCLGTCGCDHLQDFSQICLSFTDWSRSC